ncbi:MAG: HEPN domain-containing protein [Spirochaetaceae bacterium]|nr:HEPN domain-containing protein [Spirochaetaceae bacterium]
MASEYLQDMEASYARKSWNAVVRRAQEVVELSLKGVLSYLGVDFPKVHDPAAVFVATVSARGMALGEEEAADVTAVSARLARKRAPAFYFEHTENASAAEEAAADARRIHGLCTRLVATIPAVSSEPNGPASE